MFVCSHGKLVVHASRFASREGRLKPVSAAAEKMAKHLKLGMEVVTFGEKFMPVYVYYKEGREEPIPIYCDKSALDANDICVALRNMMFVLSFHPRHKALRGIRKEIMRVS